MGMLLFCAKAHFAYDEPMSSPDNIQSAAGEGGNDQWVAYVEEVVEGIDEEIQLVARRAVERIRGVEIDTSSDSNK